MVAIALRAIATGAVNTMNDGESTETRAILIYRASGERHLLNASGETSTKRVTDAGNGPAQETTKDTAAFM